MPDFSIEQRIANKGYTNIAGVDEVGRGPWAGPVTACAVILPANLSGLDFLIDVNDSKKLTAKKREYLIKEIQKHALIGLGEASVEEIDQINIRNATFLAMERAVAALPSQTNYALIDGNAIPNNLPCPAISVIKGDSVSLSIACASIVAKVSRDKLMTNLHEQFPHFGWNSNAGYGTKAHQKGLAEHGVTPHHRRSFKPIKVLLEKEKLRA